ncbi:MAG: hypothetical protein KDD69_06450 [Bdellovibrionales bacterium]|nr:hypothetical protein [Bdellovibrionales bacterium]
MARTTVRGLFTRTAVASLLVLGAAGISSCGGGGGGFFDGVARVVGQAFRPISEVIDANPIPLGEAPVTLIDFADSAVDRQLRTQVIGMTDANGNFDVAVEGQPIIAIVVNGSVDGQAYRSSGLVHASRANIAKNFNGVTDVACEALIAKINAGEVDPASVNQRTIDILEKAAADVVPTVDFTSRASVTAAANLVAARTNNGQVEASDADTTPPAEEGSLNCATQESACADGFPICAEKFCNGTIDCADGSDENPDTCGVQGSCCAATAGCPGETGSNCASECCCCGINQACDSNNFANGCIAARTRPGDATSGSLSKLIETGVYF